jgi:ketosteroid isomerase-like protein
MSDQEGFQPAWGREHGFVDLRQPLTAPGADAVSDRAAILDAVSRYSWAYDERDLPALSAVFTQNAVWDGSVQGSVPVGPYKGRAEIVEWLKGHMAAQPDQRRHCVLNQLVTHQDDGSAQVLAYLLLTSAQDGAVGVVTTGFYRFDLRKSGDGTWLIEHMFGGFDAPF